MVSGKDIIPSLKVYLSPVWPRTLRLHLCKSSVQFLSVPLARVESTLRYTWLAKIAEPLSGINGCRNAADSHLFIQSRHTNRKILHRQKPIIDQVLLHGIFMFILSRLWECYNRHGEFRIGCSFALWSHVVGLCCLLKYVEVIYITGIYKQG
jgi:hypothetical protein